MGNAGEGVGNEMVDNCMKIFLLLNFFVGVFQSFYLCTSLISLDQI